MDRTTGRREVHTVVVSDDFFRRNRWASWLREGGFEAMTCAGPRRNQACPRMTEAQ